MLAAIVQTASAQDATTTTTTTTTAITTEQQAHLALVHKWRVTVRHRRLRAAYRAAAVGIHSPPGRIEMRTTGVEYLQWMAARMHQRNLHYLAIRHRRFPKLRCIHSYEGSWSAYNSAGPYYGGFQMNAGFMQRWGADKLHKYGGRDARYWSPRDQMAVASRAVAHIGYWSWPNTAAMCGLV